MGKHRPIGYCVKIEIMWLLKLLDERKYLTGIFYDGYIETKKCNFTVVEI
jgi:hypothetical protein